MNRMHLRKKRLLQTCIRYGCAPLTIIAGAAPVVASAAAPAAATQCPLPPTAQIEFRGVRPRYARTPRPQQIVDEDALRQNDENLKNLRDFSTQVSDLSDGAISGRANAANCLQKSLAAWAAKGALLGPANSHQGKLERAWGLTTIALAAFKLDRSGSPLPEATKRWLRQVAWRVQSEEQANNRSSPTNLTLWGTLGTGTIAMLTGDEKLWTWSNGEVGEFLDEIRPDGTAPTELNRRELATGYHFYAAEPLLAFNRVAQCYDRPLNSARKASLRRFMGLLYDLRDKKTSLDERAGVKQKPYQVQRWFALLDRPETVAVEKDSRTRRLGGSVRALLRAATC